MSEPTGNGVRIVIEISDTALDRAVQALDLLSDEKFKQRLRQATEEIRVTLTEELEKRYAKTKDTSNA